MSFVNLGANYGQKCLIDEIISIKKTNINFMKYDSLY